MIASAAQTFVDNDAGYRRWLGEHPEGFVLNTYRRPRADYLRLHRSSCRLINGTPANGARWTADYIKVCGDVGQLKRWAKDQVGGELWPCAHCLPVV